ncbi:MAG TPA: phosphopantetheine-binding protein [Micromonosporaceae bacterium]
MKTIDAESLVRACVREVAPEADLDALAPDADLRETLYLDSLDFLRFVELLSEGSGRRIEEEEYPRLGSLAATIAFLAEAER